MPFNTESVDNRTFDINQPSVSPEKAFIFFHGYGGNSTYVAEQLGNPDPDNYYLVFPDGSPIPNEPDLNKRMWNGSGGVLSLIEAGFFGQIIAHLQGLGVTEIYIGGHSNGAIMASYLVATYPDYFSGAVLVSGYLHNNITNVAGGDMPIKHIHGINDLIVPVVGQNYNVADHLKKFMDAGNFVKGELLPTDHNLANLNGDNFIINAIEEIMGL